MAKIGLNNFRYGLLTEAADGTPTYDGAKKPARAVSCTVEVNNNSASLFADDVRAEADTSFNSANVTIGIDEEDQATMAEMLGHSIVNGAMIRNSSDTAPYIGFGRVVVKMVNNVRKYKVEFLYKVKFGEPSQEDETKGESLEFRTFEMEGLASELANGNWSYTEVFNTQAEAITCLENLLGGGTSVTLTYNVNGGTGSVAAVTSTEGSIITLSDGTGITPPASKVFAGWDTTAAATIPDYAGGQAYVIRGNVTLYAIYEDE